MMSMVLAVVILPLVLAPLLVIMNDERYLQNDRNGWISNTVGIVALLAAIVMALAALPLQIMGG